MTAAHQLPTPDEETARALEVARGLARAGVPVFVAPADPSHPLKMRPPVGWQTLRPDPSVVDSWRPGDGLAAVMGHTVDALDVDPRNGGRASAAQLISAGIWPTTYGRALTPSGGYHELVAPLRLNKATNFRPGVDYQGGAPDGQGRGFVWLAPTVRASKATGLLAAYRWEIEPSLATDDPEYLADVLAEMAGDDSGRSLADVVRQAGSRASVSALPTSLAPGQTDPFRLFTPDEAVQYVRPALDALRTAPRGRINHRLFEASLMLGHFVPAFWTAADAEGWLVEAQRQAWTAGGGVDDGDYSAARTTIRGGLKRGMAHPYTRIDAAFVAPVPTPPAPPAQATAPTVEQLLDPSAPASGGAPVVGDAVGPEVPVDTFTAMVEHEARRELLKRAARRRADELEVSQDEGLADKLAAAYLDGTALAGLPTPEPLIPEVLSRHTYAILRGRDASFKSFVAVDWSMCLATGTPWLGKPVERVKVLYLAGEGAYGLRKRVEAWQQARGVRLEPDWLTVRVVTVNLLRGGPAVEHLVRTVAEGGYGFVVLDTLRRVSGGADGNASQDMGLVVDRIIELKEATAGGSVLAVAHTDKGDNDTRGASNVEDDGDIVWHCKREDDNGSGFALKCHKFKDGPDGHAFELRTRVVELGGLAREDGRPETSLVVEKAAGLTKVTAPETMQQQRVHDLVKAASATGVTMAYLVDVERLPKTTVHRSLNALAGQKLIVKRGQSWYPVQTDSAAS